MNILGHDPAFWLAVIAAALLKVATSRPVSVLRGLLMGFSGVFCAWAGTNPALAWLGLDPATYTIPVAAVLTLTGEALVRFLATLTPATLLKLRKDAK